MRKTLFKSFASFIICSLFFSCTLITEEYGNIEFTLPSIYENQTRTLSTDNDFTVQLKTLGGTEVRNLILPPNSKVVLDNIVCGRYILSLRYEDSFFLVEGESEIVVRARRNNQCDVEVTYNVKDIEENDTHFPDNTLPEEDTHNPNDNVKPETPIIPDNGNGEDTTPSPEEPTVPNNPEDNVKPEPEVPNNGEDNSKPDTPDNVNPETPIEYVTYYVDGTKGNDWTNDGSSSDKPLKTVSMAVSKIKTDGNYIIDVNGTVTESKLIEFANNANVIIKGSSDGKSKIVRGTGSDFIVVGTANGKDKNNKNIEVRPNVIFQDINIQADTSERAILVYYGTVHLLDNVNIQGKAKTSVQGHVGSGSNIHVGGSVKLLKSMKLHGSCFVTIEKPLTSPITLMLLKNDGKTPNYDTAHQVVKVCDRVSLEEVVGKIKLGNKNYVIAPNGTVTKVK